MNKQKKLQLRNLQEIITILKCCELLEILNVYLNKPPRSPCFSINVEKESLNTLASQKKLLTPGK